MNHCANSSNSSGSLGWLLHLCCILILVVCTLAAFCPLVFSDTQGPAEERLTYLSRRDDGENYSKLPLFENKDITWRKVKWIWQDGNVLQVWEPIALMLKLAFAWAAGGMSRLLLAQISLGGHTLNVVLAYLTFKGNPLARLAVLLPLAVHPIHVEVLCWASALTYVFAGTFCLLSVMAHQRWTSQGSEYLSIWHFLAIVAYTCACLCKAPSLPLAVLLPFAEVACSKNAFRAVPNALLRHVAFFIAAAVLMAPQLRIDTNMFAPLVPLGLEDRLIRAGYAPLSYLATLVYPNGISNHNNVPDEPLNAFTHLVATASCSLFLTLVAILAFIFAKPNNSLKICAIMWLAFLIALSPSLGLFANHVNTMTADRYVYLALLLPFTTSPLVKALSDGYSNNRLPLCSVCSVNVAISMAILVVVSRTQVGFWKNEYVFWRNAISMEDKANFRVYLGLNYLFANDIPNAKEHLEHAVNLFRTKPMLRWDPRYGDSAGNDPVTAAVAFHNLGLIYGSEGEIEKAENAYKAAIGNVPREPWYYIWYSDFLIKTHREDDAIIVVTDLMKTVRVKRWGGAKQSVYRIPSFLQRLAKTAIEERGARDHALWIDGQAAIWAGWWSGKMMWTKRQNLNVK